MTDLLQFGASCFYLCSRNISLEKYVLVHTYLLALQSLPSFNLRHFQPLSLTIMNLGCLPPDIIRIILPAFNAFEMDDLRLVSFLFFQIRISTFVFCRILFLVSLRAIDFHHLQPSRFLLSGIRSFLSNFEGVIRRYSSQFTMSIGQWTPIKEAVWFL